MRHVIPCLALLLAACNGAPGNSTAAAPTPRPPSALQSRIAAMSDSERNVVLIRAIRDADRDCQGVTSSKRGDNQPDGALTYTATCTDGASYGVIVGADGTAQVVGAAQ